MKTTQLIDCLSSTEKKEFSFVIKSVSRKNTRKLFAFLSKKKKITTASTIFKAVFDTKHTASKDYLLRNELRLLNQLLEKFIAQKTLDTRNERYFFLQSIQERGLVVLFKKEVKKEIKKRKNEDDYEGLVRLYQLILDQNLKNKALKRINLERDIQLCQQISFYQKKAGFYHQGEIDMIKAYLTKNMQILGKNIPFSPSGTVPNIYDDAYLQYLQCKIEGFISPSEKKKESLQKALLLLGSITHYKINKEEAQVSILNNLALEYLHAFEYDNAVEAFKQLLQNKNLPIQFYHFILFNYLTCLLKAKQYIKAIEVIETKFSEPINSPLLSGKTEGIKAMAWIYAGELKKAYDELPLNLKKGSRSTYFYTRLVLSIIYYLESNYDLALREVENILQTIDDSFDLIPHKFCAQSFRKFLAIQFKPQKKLQLLSTINAFIKPEELHSDLLPLLWLRDVLMKR